MTNTVIAMAFLCLAFGLLPACTTIESTPHAAQYQAAMERCARASERRRQVSCETSVRVRYGNLLRQEGY